MTVFMRILGLVLLATTTVAAQLGRVEVPIGPRGTDISLQFFVFDSRQYAFLVIDQGGLQQQSYRNLGHAMAVLNCSAGCNGGPFNRDGTPRGLMIASGKSSGKAETGHSLTEGVLFLDRSGPRIQPAKAYFANPPPTQPRQLLQAGPFLVQDGKATAASSRRFGRHTFILTDGQFLWAIGYCPPANLGQLARALADPNTFKEFNVAAALALGGGSSCGFWVRQTHLPLYLKELDPVRNFIGLVRN